MGGTLTVVFLRHRYSLLPAPCNSRILALRYCIRSVCRVSRLSGLQTNGFFDEETHLSPSAEVTGDGGPLLPPLGGNFLSASLRFRHDDPRMRKLLDLNSKMNKSRRALAID